MATKNHPLNAPNTPEAVQKQQQQQQQQNNRKLNAIRISEVDEQGEERKRRGISVLNQKTELQRAYEKRQQHNMEQQPPSPTYGLKSELNRVIMERAQKHAQARLQNQENNDDDKQYVNPEYLNARAKLRAGQRTELK
ncbi:uncharacterized protein LOC131803542 [Musca domestica]|uniref:Uncharacterized protein LOC131803542 n=1 Tax=Musca domestica TaxID=7370 RepID=A0ABM3V562_MUSDO|nr:uncharacterized protein LOC131803542 [Musca domestica]